jgi:hypothetical protein
MSHVSFFLKPVKLIKSANKLSILFEVMLLILNELLTLLNFFSNN